MTGCAIAMMAIAIVATTPFVPYGSTAAYADTAPAGAAAPQRFSLFAPLGPASAALRVVPPRPSPPPAASVVTGLGMPPGQQCLLAIQNAERASGIPDRLLAAIARVESGRADGAGGVTPWPWSINVEGVDHVFETKADAIAAVTALQARGVRSIDVGCLQVNLMHHPDAFASLDQAFDPVINANYAARFLLQLFAQTGSWERATAWYHSATPELGEPYQRKVAAALPQERARQASAPATAPPGAPSIAGGPGAIMLGNRAELARVIAAPNGVAGRGLDRYRQAPIPIASRTAIRGPG